MNTDPKAVWGNCLLTIQQYVPQQSFKTWFEPIRPVKVDGSVMTLQVPNKFFYEWLEEHYVGVLKKAIQKELGEVAKLEYLIPRRVETNSVNKPNANFVNAEGAYTSNINETEVPITPIASSEIKNPFVIPGIKKQRIESQLREDYTFTNYIEGDCNRLARSAGLAVAKKPGETAFNPLFIFGSVGLGKTHLAQAIGNDVLRRFDDKNVIYVPSERFGNQFIEALKNNAVNDFVNFYQQIDVLIIDDIQFFAGKQKMQDMFFYIFNHLHQNGKQLILTSDRAPRELQDMEERLISRFKWGLSADLSMPDLETRIAIIEKKLTNEGWEIPYAVSEFISYNIKTNIRELEGVLISLIAQAALNDREIDIELAKEVIRHFVDNITKEITIDSIEKTIAEHFNVPLEKIKGQTRKRDIVMARQLAMFMAKNLTTSSLKTIGDYFGGRDHSTVIYSCKAVQDQLDTDDTFRDIVSSIEKKIKLSSTR
jgi:chromosomal replication initiator protein